MSCWRLCRANPTCVGNDLSHPSCEQLYIFAEGTIDLPKVDELYRQHQKTKAGRNQILSMIWKPKSYSYKIELFMYPICRSCGAFHTDMTVINGVAVNLTIHEPSISVMQCIIHGYDCDNWCCCEPNYSCTQYISHVIH